jgi:LEA14-like dessication related protein
MKLISLQKALPLIGIILFISMSGCKLKDISANIALVKVNKVSLEDTGTELRIMVENPSIIPIMLNKIDVDIFIAGTHFLKVVHEGPINIKGHSSTQIVFPLSFRFDHLYKIAKKAMNKEDLDFSAEGVITLDAIIGEPDVYFKISGTLPTGIMPEITLDSWRIREMNFRHTLFDIALKIKNTGTENQEIKNFDYSAGFKYLDVLDKENKTITLLKPGESLLIDIPVEIDIASIRNSGFDEIVLEKLAQIRMRDLCTFGVAFGDEPTGFSRFAIYALDTISTGLGLDLEKTVCTEYQTGSDFDEMLKATEPDPQIAEPDFVTERILSCALYKEALNDIKRSANYSDYFDTTLLKPFFLKDVPGILRTLSTSRGGGIVLITVDTQFGTFGNNDMLQGGFVESRREIRIKSDIYNDIGMLAEGQRVIFSGNLIMAEKELTEKMSLCGDGWLIKFTDIKADEY